ncbi:MAG: hypothetical protein AAGA81_23585 [Acidobacteriota bacterium]
MEIPRFDARDPVAEMSSALDDAGCVAVEGAQSREHAEEVNEELVGYPIHGALGSYDRGIAAAKP